MTLFILFQFNVKDKLPKFFCPDCIKSLKAAYKFKLQCELTYNKLLSAVETITDVTLSVNEKLLKPYEFKIEINPNKFEEIDCNNDKIVLPEESQILKNTESQNILNVDNDDNVILEDNLINNIDSYDDNILYLDENNSDDDFKDDSNQNDNETETSTEKDNIYQYFKCGLCKKEIFSKYFFGQHIRKEHFGNKKLGGFYLCQYCDKSRVFIDASALTLHIKQVHMNMGLKTKSACETCGKYFHNKTNLQRHINTVHLNLRPFSCHLCNLSFGQQCQLTGHIRLHSKPRNFKCVQCSRSFTSLAGLKYHKISHLPLDQRKTARENYQSNLDRSKPKSIICEICGKAVANYFQHMNLHTNNKPYKCTLCPKSFRLNSALTTHMRSHTNEKPYKCHECNNSFRQLAHLNTHSKIHTGQKPYKCSYCEKSFSGSGNFLEHVRRMHTNEKPYQCLMCQSNFVNGKEVKRHIKNLHPNFDQDQIDEHGNQILGYIRNGRPTK